MDINNEEGEIFTDAERDTLIDELATDDMRHHVHHHFDDENHLYTHCIDEGGYRDMDDNDLLEAYRETYGKIPQF